jgi:type I restriction enzyme, S subunit
MKLQTKNTPSLRFPEFCSSFEKRELGLITTWSSGGTPPKNISSYWDGDIPWISASTMRGIEYFDSDLKLTYEGLLNGSKIAPKESLLILVRGSMLFKSVPVGRVVKDVAFNQDVKAIRCNSEVLPSFLLYWLLAAEPKLLSLVTGTGIGAGKLDLADLQAIPISLPELAEQEKIAAFLSVVDKKIGQLARKKELLLKYKKAVMQQIFDQKVRFKDERGKDFPNWEMKRLGDNTIWASGGTPAKDVTEYWNGDIPWISASSMRGSSFSDSDLKITSKGLQNGSRLAPKGSLLILVRGSMLYKSVPVGIAVRDVAFNQDVKSIKCINELSANFLLYLLIHSQNRLLNMVTSTGIGAGKIDLVDLKNVLVSIPVPDEQNKISDFLFTVDDEIGFVSKQLDLTRKFKKGLLQQMFV